MNDLGEIHCSFSSKYKELFTTKARYIHLLGGRGRGGSYTATQYFLARLTMPSYFRGYFMREVFTDVRESLWRDFKDRIEENETLDEGEFEFNDSQMSCSFPQTGNMIMSKGFKKSAGNRTAKLKSLAGATHVVIEEADEISEADFMQLDDTFRTIKSDIQIILIFNLPPKGHFIYKRWYTLIDADVPGYFRAVAKKDAALLSLFSTYYDNLANINEETAALWESYKQTNSEHYWTIIRGYVSEGVRGRIHKNWKPIDRMPGEFVKWYGLDWGFSGDPLALMELERNGKQLFVDQLIYESGLVNDMLDRKMQALGIPRTALIIADKASPKDIEDMRLKGWNIIKSEGGPGSINSGINYLSQFEVFMTTRSVEAWFENENYAYMLDRDKNPTKSPMDKHNHAMDAIRIAMDKLRNPMGTKIIMPGKRTTNGRTNYSM